MVRTSLGYPDEASELTILEHNMRGNGGDLEAVLKPDQILAIRSLVGRLEVKPEVRQYVVRVVRATRESPRLSLGGGPRASIALLRMAGAWALLDQRDYVTVDDVKTVAVPVLAHRMVEADGEISPVRRQTVNEILETVPSPL
jgi:MoxR-like ATPase